MVVTPREDNPSEGNSVEGRINSSPAGLERLYRAEGKKMWRALALHTGSPDVASDAVAEAFAQALRRGEAIERPDRWVWKAAFRIAAGELEHRGRETAVRAERGYDFPHETVALANALGRLSPMQRGSIILHYYGGYTSSEAASILGSSSAAVRVHLFRARRRLAELMEVSGDD
jgi:RNA polymerase sigma factor (sigma-70 family)